MTKIEKVTALLYCFQLGIVKNIDKLVAENFVQHNLKTGAGRGGLIHEIENLTKLNKLTQIRILTIENDGDYVFSLSIYNFGSGEFLGFDVFRFNKENKIAEHWDNLSGINKFNFLIKTESFASENPVPVEQVEKNKKLVQDFFEKVVIKYNRSVASEFYEEEEFRKNALVSSPMYEIASDKAIIKRTFYINKTHFVLGSRNLVLLAASGRHNNDHIAYYAIFFMKNNKIVRHYDIVEKIAEESEFNSKNHNEKF